MGVDELQQLGWVNIHGVMRAPEGIPEPKTAELADYKRPSQGSVRTLAPCGTPAAYQRHRRHGESCARCDAHRTTNSTRAGTR